jgi:hypothetical protein
MVAGTCFAQSVTLSLSSGSGPVGGVVTLSLSMNSSGSQPAAVQWDIDYSPTDISALSVAASPTSTAAGKSVTCNSGTGTSRCVLWGLDSTTIPNGVLATVTLTLSGSTLNTLTSVQLANGMASAPDGTSIPTTATGGTITIIQPTFNISGTITPAANGSGATVTLSGAGSATATADSSGNYTFTGLANGAYTVTPSKTGFVFTPASRSVTVSGANQTAVSFTAASRCDLNNDGAVNALDVQLVINSILSGVVGLADLNRDGVANLLDLQLLVNVVLGTGSCPL